MDCSLPRSSAHGIFQARVLEWVAISFSRGSSKPRDQIQVSHTAGRFFTIWATREAQEYWSGYPILSSQDLPNPEIEPGSPALQVDSFKPSYQRISLSSKIHHKKIKKKINKDNSKICGPRKGRLLKSVLVKTSQGKQKSN